MPYRLIGCLGAGFYFFGKGRLLGLGWISYYYYIYGWLIVYCTY